MLDTLTEDEIVDVFKSHLVLPSSEVFYLVNDTDGVAIKQSKAKCR